MIRPMKNLLIPFLLLTGLLLGSCSHFRMHYVPIEQGRIIAPQTLQKVKVGQSTQAVQKLIGKPLTKNLYNKNQWHYIYTLRDDRNQFSGKTVTLVFNNNRLISITQKSIKASDHHVK